MIAKNENVEVDVRCTISGKVYHLHLGLMAVVVVVVVDGRSGVDDDHLVWCERLRR